MQGKLIVIEGIDGSGKSTQYKKMCDRLSGEGFEFEKISFPRYDKDSSALVRAYLGGEFGSRPDDVNAYAASTFYAVDRFASFKTDWEKYYNGGGTVLMDRYTTSNACHQGGKLEGEERLKYFNWLYEFEFRLMGLPEPSLVIYLNTDIEVSRRQINARQSETGANSDIHENDFNYLQRCLDAGRCAASHYGWRVVECIRDSQMRTVDDISDEIYNIVLSHIGK